MTEDAHGRSGAARGLGRVVSGLFVLTTGEGEGATGMLASFVQQAGFEPPAVTVAVAKGRGILDELRRCGRFCISILHDQSMGLLAHFARGFEPGQPAFENVSTAVATNGVPYLTDAHAYIACEVIGEADWTDHVVFCGAVVGGDRSDDDQPLTHVRKDGLKY
jgi:flavin reductase (DIM6/NTAB) family NADH-FMN oxidoreductase RutF